MFRNHSGNIESDLRATYIIVLSIIAYLVSAGVFMALNHSLATWGIPEFARTTICLLIIVIDILCAIFGRNKSVLLVWWVISIIAAIICVFGNALNLWHPIMNWIVWVGMIFAVTILRFYLLGRIHYNAVHAPNKTVQQTQ